MSTNNQNLSTPTRRKKRLIIMGCCLGAVGLIGGGIGIGYAVSSPTHKDNPGTGDSALTLTTNISEVKTDAETTTVIQGTFKPFNFTVNTLSLTGTNADKFDSFTPDISAKSFTVRVKESTNAGTYKLQIKANDKNDLVSNEITITVDNPIPARNDVHYSGYIQSKSTSTVTVTVKGYLYTMSNANNAELAFTTATSPDQHSHLNISTGVLNTGDNTMTYTVSIRTDSATTDIVGYFALVLNSTQSGITDDWNSGDIVIHPAVEQSVYMSVDNSKVVSDAQTITGTITPHNFSTINSVALAAKTTDNDNDKFQNLAWSSGNTFAVTSKRISGVYKLQVNVNNGVLSNTCLINVVINQVPDNKYYAVNNSNEVRTGTASGILTLSSQNLKTLLLGYCPTLTVLNCSGNDLSALDVSDSPALTALYCNVNSLSTLDVSGNPALTELNCSGNSLSTLDVSGSPALTALYCGGNSLSTLDVSGNPALTTLVSENNSPLNSILLPIYTTGSHSFAWIDLTNSCAAIGDITLTATYTTLTGSAKSGWTTTSR